MDFKNKKFKKFTVSRTPPKNLQNEDIFLFETELTIEAIRTIGECLISG